MCWTHTENLILKKIMSYCEFQEHPQIIWGDSISPTVGGCELGLDEGDLS